MLEGFSRASPLKFNDGWSCRFCVLVVDWACSGDLFDMLCPSGESSTAHAKGAISNSNKYGHLERLRGGLISLIRLSPAANERSMHGMSRSHLGTCNLASESAESGQKRAVIPFF